MSKIEVNKIGPQCGTTLTVGCGAGQTVAVDANTVTIGRCGGTVALASGASQTGFGREGSVDWQTGSIKTAGTFTAASGEGYFIDTSGGGVTANLPAGSAGAIVAFADYKRTFGSNALTIVPNGSNKIGGVAANANLNTNGESATFVFVDATEGWINVQQTETSQTGGVDFMAATGGTVTTVCTNFKVHVFNSPGTFCVSQVSNVDAARNIVAYTVVGAGGGGGSSCAGGGGGAGGFREGRCSSVVPYTASPLVAASGLTVTASAFPIVVGAGGAKGVYPNGKGGTGNVSTFSTITSAGGGAGGGNNCEPGAAGGSGGGGSHSTGTGGAGNTPSVSPAQGKNGGAANPGSSPSSDDSGGSGGGAGACGQSGGPFSGGGGNGVATSITGASVTRAGGGGGGDRNVPQQSPGLHPGGSGGGGDSGGSSSYPRPAAASNGADGTANTGGGGGGGVRSSPTNSPGRGDGGLGGSGVVIIRYKFQ